MSNFWTKQKKLQIIGVMAFIALIAVLLGIYYGSRGKPDSQSKNSSVDGANVQTADDSVSFDGKDVVIEVIGSDGSGITYEITTHADCLKEVMDEADGLEYETADGMVMVVNGERADYVKDGAYWAFYVNGSYCNYGISDQPVNDGDEFGIVYTKA